MKYSAKETAQAIGHEAQVLRQRLAEGTEDLSQAARERVIAARERALEARAQVSRAARNGSDGAADLFDRQPLVVGALAFAVGAAIGALLPKTRTEDSYVGARRDALMSEAERVFSQEKARAQAVFSAAKDEAVSAVSDAQDAAKTKLKTTVNQAEDMVKDAASDVVDRANKAAKSN